MKQQLLIATRNKHKKKEIQEIIDGLNIELLGLDDVDELPEIIEDGQTFEENAIKKASVTAKLTGITTLADDSGLVVDVLSGQPGIYSARFAGLNADDEKNNQKLLGMMDQVDQDQRTARFVCVVALATPEGKTQTVEGRCEGKIATNPHGADGFGYDPLFIPEGFEQSFAQLGADAKNLISHRGIALAAIRPILEALR
ncbi:MAG: XTP/dITP diphosphatase [Bacillota bacterium]|nr:XTP/dITP diphosphatase [Bacillota bacterium]